jgi:cell division control protein 7
MTFQRVDLDVQTRCYHTSASKLHPHGEPKRVDAAEALRVKSLVLESRKKAAGPPERVGIPSDDSRYENRCQKWDLLT